jgi:hypothetical protein
MFGAATLSTALLIDKYLQRCDAAAAKNLKRRSAHAQVHGGIPAPSILVQVEERDRKFATKRFEIPADAPADPSRGRLVWRAGPLHVRHICNTSRESNSSVKNPTKTVVSATHSS